MQFTAKEQKNNILSNLKFPKSFPNQKEEEFLRLILSTDEDFPKLWNEWKASIPFEDIDPATTGLLPLVYLRLQKLQIKDELTGKISGIYKLAWVKNQRLLSVVKEVADICHEENIPILTLKGIPLLLEVYKNMGAR
ncbi:nucleotidyltransferase family protein, partial [Patescibacteria group bacterium]|nr:nucleotidyltransferase family protein [Patescibacteria group bacterium]